MHQNCVHRSTWLILNHLMLTERKRGKLSYVPKIQHYYFNFRNIEQYGYIGKYTSVILKIKSQSEGQQKNSYLGDTDSGRNPTVIGLGGKGKGYL